VIRNFPGRLALCVAGRTRNTLDPPRAAASGFERALKAGRQVCSCGEHRRGELFSGFDRWWRAAGGAFIGDDLAQILNAVLGKGGHAILLETVNLEAGVFGNMSIDSWCSGAANFRPRRADWRRSGS